jgi:triacylglycerol lipase
VTQPKPVDRQPPRWRGPLLVGLAAAVIVAIAVVATVITTGRSTAHQTALPPPATAARSSAAQATSSAAASSATSEPSPTRESPASSAVPVVPGPRPADDRPGPVILVPGYGGDDQMLVGLADRLHRAGRTTTLLQLPNNAEGDLHEQAQVLAARVTQLLKAGAPSVDLVGYSAGGIVVGLFVAAHPQQVRRVVSIGSPMHGTDLAGLAAGFLPSACPVACQQMVPGTSLLASLVGAEPARTGVPWLSIWTTNDQVVQPADSARVNGALNVVLQDVCADDRVDHINLPADPLVAALTLKGLGTGVTAVPKAADCSALRTLGAA